MSKLIVEMEMTRKNRFCGLQCADLYCVKTSKKCNVFDTGERPSWCPIKGELPDEHGDLIDRDIMYKDIQLWKSTATDTITMCFLYHVEKLLMSIRPIIEAERKDDGN